MRTNAVALGIAFAIGVAATGCGGHAAYRAHKLSVDQVPDVYGGFPGATIIQTAKDTIKINLHDDYPPNGCASVATEAYADMPNYNGNIVVYGDIYDPRFLRDHSCL